ncbi:MAG: hypothetical protein AAB152_15235 [Candidatus Coatesbacteria bacterium]
MKVLVDRLNGTLAIEVSSGPAVRTVTMSPDVTAALDRFGHLRVLTLLRPLEPGIRKTILPRLAAQFHVPALAHMDPALFLEKVARHN